MTSILLKITFQPQSPFITPLASDTLFGQLCWAIRHRFGQKRLIELLEDYTLNQPFAVLSTPLPCGYLPRPTVPLPLLGFDLTDATKRKDTKKKLWLKKGDDYALLAKPISAWHNHSASLGDMIAKDTANNPMSNAWQKTVTQPHNSINRLTNTTGSENGFAPFSMEATHYHPQSAFYDLYVVLDESRLSQADLMAALADIGAFGYGKEASTGAGKFTVGDCHAVSFTAHAQANAYLTLGHCTPQGQAWQTERCYYNTTVRFGRHGADAVHLGNPYKNPVLMATTGALLSPIKVDSFLYVGQGLSGLSNAEGMKGTVQQGYAPVLPVYVDWENK